jgi:hypothetical protein
MSQTTVRKLAAAVRVDALLLLFDGGDTALQWTPLVQLTPCTRARTGRGRRLGLGRRGCCGSNGDSSAAGAPIRRLSLDRGGGGCRRRCGLGLSDARLGSRRRSERLRCLSRSGRGGSGRTERYAALGKLALHLHEARAGHMVRQLGAKR